MLRFDKKSISNIPTYCFPTQVVVVENILKTSSHDYKNTYLDCKYRRQTPCWSDINSLKIFQFYFMIAVKGYEYPTSETTNNFANIYLFSLNIIPQSTSHEERKQVHTQLQIKLIISTLKLQFWAHFTSKMWIGWPRLGPM